MPATSLTCRRKKMGSLSPLVAQWQSHSWILSCSVFSPIETAVSQNLHVLSTRVGSTNWTDLQMRADFATLERLLPQGGHCTKQQQPSRSQQADTDVVKQIANQAGAIGA